MRLGQAMAVIAGAQGKVTFCIFPGRVIVETLNPHAERIRQIDIKSPVDWHDFELEVATNLIEIAKEIQQEGK